MAEYASGWQVESSSIISGNITGPDTVATLDGYLGAQIALFGTLTDQLPISENPVSLSGIFGLAGSGNDTFYNRIIVSMPTIAAGNVITDQAYTINIWNGYFVNRTLNSIASSGGEGLSLISAEALPSLFSPLEEQAFTLNVGVTGPALINATYSLVFDNGTEFIAATGSRIFLWNYFPDWSAGVLDRYEFLTDIIESYNGTEQRISLRNQPNRSYEYQFLIDNNNDRRKFEALLFSWGANVWMLPIWTEGSLLTTSLPANSLTLTPSRISGDYLIGGNLVLRTSAFVFEVCQIDGISGGVITLARGTNNAWPVGTSIYPALPAYIDEAQRVERFTGDTLSGYCRFKFTDFATPPSYTHTFYRSYPVITTQPLWLQDLTADYTRKYAQLDYQTGLIVREDEAGMPFVIMSHHWMPTNKAEIDSLKGFLYSLRGRQKMVWLPTFLQDLIVVAQIGSASTSIDISFGFVTQHLLGKIGRRDIRIETNSGAVYYRRVSGASELSASVERLTIDSALGVALMPSDIMRVSWMMPARLNADAVELAWGSDTDLSCSVQWRGVRDAV